jgi:hypothetical protein
MTPLIPLSEVENETPPLPRKRRVRSSLPFLGQEDRDRVLDDLSQRAFPRLDFYLYAILAAILLSLGFLLPFPVLVILAVVVAPLLGPFAGFSLGVVTLSPRFAFRNLAALVVAGMWVFLSGLLVAWIGSFSASGIPPSPATEIAGMVVIAIAAAWLTLQFIRSSAKTWMPNAVVSYLLLLPLCAAAWSFVSGKNDAMLAALLTAGLYFSLALAASAITYIALEFRPSEHGWRTYAGLAIAVSLAVLFLAAWVGIGGPGAQPALPPTPTVQPTATEAATATPLLQPIETGEPSSTPTRAPTDTPGPTETPTFVPVSAVVIGTGTQGANLRDKPDGKLIGSAMEGENLQVIGTPVIVGTQSWIPVRNAQGLEAWMAVEYCATVTPTAAATATLAQ